MSFGLNCLKASEQCVSSRFVTFYISALEILLLTYLRTYLLTYLLTYCAESEAFSLLCSMRTSEAPTTCVFQ